MKLTQYNSVADLRQNAAHWDDLWRRSDATLPTLKSACLALWLEQFAAGRQFVALAVEDEGRLVAALPLIGARVKGVSCGALPRNCWSDAGDLLLDAASTPDEALQMLIEGVRALPWSVVTADGVDVESPRWREFLDLFLQRGCEVAWRPQFHVGLVDIGGNWEAYESAWSSNHRRAIRKSFKRLQADGDVELRRRFRPKPAEAAELLRRLCELEDKGWKGNAGTSILRTPGMFEFFRRQAELLAEEGHAELLFLEQGECALAAEYGYAAKGVFHSHKIAYDPQFRDFGPGQLLRHAQLHEYFSQTDYHLLDTLGILSEANAKWSTRSYTVSRAVMSAGGLLGNGLVRGYRRLWPTVRRWFGTAELPPPPKLGAEDYLVVHSSPQKCQV